MLNRGFGEPIMERPGEWVSVPVNQRYSLYTHSRSPNNYKTPIRLSHEDQLYDVCLFICVICIGSK